MDVIAVASDNALVYYIDPGRRELGIDYPILLDGSSVIHPFLTFAVMNNQDTGYGDYSKTYDFFFPPSALKLHYGPSGPARCIVDLVHILGQRKSDDNADDKPGSAVVGWWSLGIHPKPFSEFNQVGYNFWLGGDGKDLIRGDDPLVEEIPESDGSHRHVVEFEFDSAASPDPSDAGSPDPLDEGWERISVNSRDSLYV